MSRANGFDVEAMLDVYEALSGIDEDIVVSTYPPSWLGGVVAAGGGRYVIDEPVAPRGGGRFPGFVRSGWGIGLAAGIVAVGVAAGMLWGNRQPPEEPPVDRDGTEQSETAESVPGGEDFEDSREPEDASERETVRETEGLETETEAREPSYPDMMIRFGGEEAYRILGEAYLLNGRMSPDGEEGAEPVYRTIREPWEETDVMAMVESGEELVEVRYVPVDGVTPSVPIVDAAVLYAAHAVQVELFDTAGHRVYESKQALMPPHLEAEVYYAVVTMEIEVGDATRIGYTIDGVDYALTEGVFCSLFRYVPGGEEEESILRETDAGEENG